VAVGLPPFETSSARAVNVITALAADAEPRAGFHISAHTARILAETDGRFLPTVRATLVTCWAKMPRVLVMLFRVSPVPFSPTTRP